MLHFYFVLLLPPRPAAWMNNAPGFPRCFFQLCVKRKSRETFRCCRFAKLRLCSSYPETMKIPPSLCSTLLAHLWCVRCDYRIVTCLPLFWLRLRPMTRFESHGLVPLSHLFWCEGCSSQHPAVCPPRRERTHTSCAFWVVECGASCSSCFVPAALPCPVLPCLAVRSSQSSAEAEREAKKAAARLASTSALDGGGGKRART